MSQCTTAKVEKLHGVWQIMKFGAITRKYRGNMIVNLVVAFEHV